VKATNACLYARGSFDTTIAILDSGIDYSNSELTKRASQCINTLENSFSCQDEFGHGTHVASIIGAEVDNKYGTCGISWFNPILPVRVSDEYGNATVSTVIIGLDKAIKAKAKIVVISLSTNKLSEALKLAIEEANKRGILVVASGGNTGVQEVRFPAGYNNVVGVGSIDLSNQKSLFSSFGPHIKLVAPGENILVPELNSSSYLFVSGTSFSVPQVAGIAALVWSVKSELSRDTVKEILFSTASDLGEQGYDYKYGYGLVNAEKAVKKALGFN
jgi:subtilisin family serine protease